MSFWQEVNGGEPVRPDEWAVIGVHLAIWVGLAAAAAVTVWRDRRPSP